MSKFVIHARWISYSQTNIYDGQVARPEEYDVSRSPAAVTESIYLVDALDIGDAIEKVRQVGLWEVPPTTINGTSAEIGTVERSIQYITTVEAPYWRYRYRGSDELAEQWGLTKRGAQAHIAKLHERFGVGRKIGRDWLLSPDEAERYRPGPVGRPRKEKSQ